MYRPAVSAHSVAAVEGAGEKHVLGADEYGVALRVNVPFASVIATHEHMNTDVMREVQLLQPPVDVLACLFD